mmetsp:Transcript_43435/g.98141  ORF Transcript_43435/g.98141 Transcript_43435/m.98141 type:complete len:108 (-) Transcript_43435:457-780(-)
MQPSAAVTRRCTLKTLTPTRSPPQLRLCVSWHSTKGFSLKSTLKSRLSTWVASHAPVAPQQLRPEQQQQHACMRAVEGHGVGTGCRPCMQQQQRAACSSEDGRRDEY